MGSRPLGWSRVDRRQQLEKSPGETFGGGAVEVYLAGIVPIRILTTVCLVRWRADIYELIGHTKQMTASHYQRWIPVKRRQSEER